MTNKQISQFLKLTANLLEILDGNAFKIKSLLAASFKIDKLPIELSTLAPSEIETIEGIGKGISAKIIELLQHKTTSEMNELIQEVPEGVVKMLNIKGLGPKKISLLWRELGIESMGELLYACNENRLVSLKGFGEKTQESIKKSIEFIKSNEHKFLWAQIEEAAYALLRYLQEKYPAALFAITGDFRRKCEIIEIIEILSTEKECKIDELDLAFRVKFIPVTKENFYVSLLQSTGPQSFFESLKINPLGLPPQGSEEQIFEYLGYPYIEPVYRDKINISNSKINSDDLNKIIQPENISGIFHVHTTFSDGTSSVKDMALAVKNKGLHYIGISDHSRSAFYANGLSPERVYLQHHEINQLNIELAPFKIFKGIESDVLIDGALDYEEEVLKEFDFVIASVHSVLRMDIEKATNRLLKAIENPYTTMLGHMTGRLLLSRPGYPLHYHKIIDACAQNNVIIELNANPHRLDIDWRLLDYCLNKGVLISINPDAHSIKGLDDIMYGVYAAQKGILPLSHCFNAFDINDIIHYFKSKQPL